MCLVNTQRPQDKTTAMVVNMTTRPCRKGAITLPGFSPRMSSSMAPQLLRRASRQQRAVKLIKVSPVRPTKWQLEEGSIRLRTQIMPSTKRSEPILTTTQLG